MKRKVAELQALLYQAAGGKFDIGSHVEVGRVLYERLRLPVPACAVKKAGRHPSTANEVGPCATCAGVTACAAVCVTAHHNLIPELMGLLLTVSRLAPFIAESTVRQGPSPNGTAMGCSH